jgi:hypothetical protein
MMAWIVRQNSVHCKPASLQACKPASLQACKPAGQKVCGIKKRVFSGWHEKGLPWQGI